MSNFSSVAFHGDTIYCVTHNNEPYAPVKPIIENMGLDWKSQFVKIKNNKDRWGIVMITIPSMVNITIEQNVNRETYCMPVRKLPAFLATINPKKVKPELREKIERYQAECDDALWNYWTQGEAKRQQALPQETQDTENQISTVNERVRINNLVKRWAKSKKKSHFECWKIIHKEFDISTIAMLPSNKVSAVCDFILDKIDNPAERPTPPPLPEAVQSTLPVAKPQLTFLPAEQKLPPLMFEYEPDYFAEFHARKMLNECGYKPYAYNAFMLSYKACDIFNDFEQKIKQLMKDYERISKPVYKEMFGKVINGNYDAPHNTSGRDRHNEYTNFTSTMWQTIDSTYSKLMYSRSDYLRNEVDQMIQTLRHTAKVLDM